MRRRKDTATPHQEGGGDFFVPILLILGISFLPRLFYMPYAIRKLKILFFKKKLVFLPLLPGVWKIVGTLYTQKNENHHMAVFDSLDEASGCTDYNAKNLNSFGLK